MARGALQIPDGVKRRFFGFEAGLLVGREDVSTGRTAGLGRTGAATLFAASDWAVFSAGSAGAGAASEAAGSLVGAGSLGGCGGGSAACVTGSGAGLGAGTGSADAIGAGARGSSLGFDPATTSSVTRASAPTVPPTSS